LTGSSPAAPGANPAGSIQVLQEKLVEAFGFSATANIVLSLVQTLEDPPTYDILKVHLELDAGYKQSLGISIPGLDALGDVLDLAGAAELSVEVTGRLILDLGIGISDPSRIYLFKTSGISKRHRL